MFGQPTPPPPWESTAHREAIRRYFSPAPTGRPYEKFEWDESGKLLIPEGVDPHRYHELYRATVGEQGVVGKDPETGGAIRQPEWAGLHTEGFEKPSLGKGGELRRTGPESEHVERTTGAERIGTRTQRMDDPEVRVKFAEYLQKHYKEGATRQQTAKAAAMFLRGDEGDLSSQSAPVSQKLINEFLNYDEAGKKKKQAKPFTSMELRRARQEIDL